MPSHTASERRKAGSVNRGGFGKMPQANPQKRTGGQGNGGPRKGPSSPHVNNPKGITPKKIGGGLGPLSRPGNQPKVGR